MALSHNPIPSDPGYDTCTLSDVNRSFPRSRGRTRPEATSIAHKHQRGSLEYLFCTDLSPPSTHIKYTVPKNHYKENWKRIKQIQFQSKKKQEAQKPLPVHQKSIKYDKIPPKVTVCMQSTCSPSALRVTQGHVELNPNADSERVHPVCKHTSEGLKSKKNFLAINITNAAKTRPKEPHVSLSEGCNKELSGYKKGMVPAYLQKRKEELRVAEQHRIASLPDPTVPHGYAVMPEKERFNTLRILQESLSALTAELQSLPLHSDTLRVRNKKAQAEVRLSEVEDAIKIFSKPKVYIKVD